MAITGDLTIVNGSIGSTDPHNQAFARLLALDGTTTANVGFTPVDLLQRRIQDAVDMCQRGLARACMDQLQRLRRDEWAGACSRNRCRLMAGIGYAHYALGDSGEASETFRLAFAEDPDNRGQSVGCQTDNAKREQT